MSEKILYAAPDHVSKFRNEYQIIKSITVHEHAFCDVEPTRSMIVCDGPTTSQVVTSAGAYWQFIILGGETVRFVRVSFVHLFIWPVARNFLHTDRKGERAQKHCDSYREGHLYNYIYQFEGKIISFFQGFSIEKLNTLYQKRA